MIKRMHWLVFGCVAVGLVLLSGLAAGLFWWTMPGAMTAGGGLSATDQRIGRVVEAALVAELTAMGPGDPIHDRYGPFQGFSGVRVRRPNYGWQLVTRLDLTATAHFAKADAPLSLGISHGPSLAITRLQMHPSPEWRAANPQQAGTLQKVGNELWQVAPGSAGRSRCVISGWAVHPDFDADG